MEFVKSTEEENKLLEEVLDGITVNSEMSLLDKEFLNSLILRLKPKKILEVGVAAGSSSVVILNAIKNDPDATLYSIDFSEQWYRNGDYKTGFLVQRDFSHLADKWKLYAGDFAMSYMDEIGVDIDFCLIDTVHAVPGEILDFLMVLPFLKEHAVVVFHDTALNAAGGGNNGYLNLILISAITGLKFVPYNIPRKNLYYNFHNQHPEINNIGAIALGSEAKESLFDYFNLLMLPWQYKIERSETERIKAFYERFYPRKYMELYEKAVNYNLRMLG